MIAVAELRTPEAVQQHARAVRARMMARNRLAATEQAVRVVAPIPAPPPPPVEPAAVEEVDPEPELPVIIPIQNHSAAELIDIISAEAPSRRLRLHDAPTVEFCIAITSLAYGVPVSSLKGDTRRSDIVRVRHAGMWCARELTGRSLPFIGERFGKRDHTTVMHACRRMDALRLSDNGFASDLDKLREVVTEMWCRRTECGEMSVVEIDQVQQ